MAKLKLIAFDADDTLWHNERFFRTTEASFAAMLRDHADEDHLSERLLETERRNLARYGYGIKGFVLSMIETAIEVTDGKAPAHLIRQIIDAGHEMMKHPVELMPHAAETVEALRKNYKVILLTKGDLFDQERKIALSGLADMFEAIEIVSDKNIDTYRTFFTRYGEAPASTMMVGNSLKSDVIPAIEAGGWGVYVPQEDLAWAMEHADKLDGHERFREIANLGDLPELVSKL